MKRILLIALVFGLFSCNESSKEKAHRLCMAYYDSVFVYHLKWQCCFDNKEYHKADSLDRIIKFYSDSGDYYYRILNPPKPAKIPEKQIQPCDCK